MSKKLLCRLNAMIHIMKMGNHNIIYDFSVLEESAERIESLETELKKAVEALEHYAKGDGMASYREENKVFFWNGDKAREALESARSLLNEKT